MGHAVFAHDNDGGGQTFFWVLVFFFLILGAEVAHRHAYTCICSSVQKGSHVIASVLYLNHDT